MQPNCINSMIIPPKGFVKSRCPRCQGELYLDEAFDIHGWHTDIVCLRCGYRDSGNADAVREGFRHV